MASNDTTFIKQVTGIVAAWLQPINDFVFKGRNPNFVTSTGSANAYTLTLPAGTLYTTPQAGDLFTFKANFSNTASAALTIVGAALSGPYTLYAGGATLTSGSILNGAIVQCVFDGTYMQMVGGVATSAGLAGGTAGALPWQSAAGTTGFTAAGSPGQTLYSSGTGAAPVWGPSTPYVDVTGTADALIATFNPAFTTLTDGMVLAIGPAYANATTTPTLNVNGLGAKTIVKNNAAALAAGDIAGASAQLLVEYNATNAQWTLINPATTTVTGLSVAGGKTLSVNNSLTLAGTDGTTMTFPPASASLGYLTVPPNAQSAAYTTVLADVGKCIEHPASDANARTFTIDSHTNVAWPDGACITFENWAAQAVTIAVTTDTLVWSPTGTTGSRTLAQYGMATARYTLATNKWLITGTGLT